MASLAARAFENASARRESEDLDQPRDLSPVPLEREERLVFEEVLGVEVRRPPVARARRSTRQKNTGSR